MFRYLTPREGTETVSHVLRKPKQLKRSDTLLPARGRKHGVLQALLTETVLFRYLIPREGTETLRSSRFPSKRLLFRHLAPREGTETHSPASLRRSKHNRSDTLLPARGLTYIILSQRKKPTCNACGLLLFSSAGLGYFFTRIFDLPHDG